MTETDLGPLPDDWEAIRVHDVVLRTRQTDPTRTPDSPFKYIDVSAVSSERLRIESSADYIGKDAPSRARKVIKANDVIFATVRPYLKRVAIVPADLDGQICSTAFCVLRANPDRLDPDFLYFAAVTDRFVQSVAEHQRGSSYPAVRDSDVLNEPIPLPPLPEQRAIAQVLRTVQQAKEATEKVIAACRHLKQSLMRHLFTYGPVPFDQADKVALKETDFGPVPADWPVEPLSRCSTVQTGVAKGRRLNGAVTITVPYLRVANVQDGFLDLREMKEITIRRSEITRYSLEGGDVVLTEGGDFDKLGRGFVWNGEVPGCVHQNHIFAVRVRPDRLSPEFLAYMTQSHYGKSYFLTVAHKTTNLACINTTKLKAFPVLLPPLPHQERMVQALRKVDHKLVAEQRRHQAITTVFNSLLHQLMTGKVRVA